jgi:hypothetical protein
MYRDPPSQELLQGDVIDLIEYPVRRLIAAADGHLNIVVKRSRVALLSHSCDMANREKRHGILFAPLMQVPFGIKRKEELLAQLKSALIADQSAFINLFFFGAHAGVGDVDQVVDFATMQSLPSTLAPMLLELKRAELDAEAREHLKQKLALHFARPE